ncbi:TetR/AcrR family transcriptional regulator [Streptomyces sioyaensis]|uniref:TetR/AcrR family transcriptional regulator n=1 Tax=Streptomyces sioyaensis TaxID=67364 RepID=A0A4V1NPN7_9ACTN|nr:TetR/AcrR family transcriptional regulator [Streptomyces sioyaensis]MBM4794074.1 TetR/AcrR family transcriptional regulator [Streptomyces sioyaensis]RXS65460.1 TetR/AcrR family transcriptional regulator [Streptomyces sioyaensis]
MARPRDPHRRTEILDAVIGHLAETGIAQLSLRPLAQALGHSTRVLTHHFTDKDALLTAVLQRLDEIQHGQLRATEGWEDTTRGVGAIVRDSWRRHLEPENIGATRLLHEIEGLAAAGRLGGRVPAFLADRAEFVAGALQARGLAPAAARVRATFLNSAYAGLRTDFLVTGDRERTEAALAELCALADSWTAAVPS